MKEVLIDYFKLEAKETSIKRELLAGATTFITMVYIIFVNPSMMAEAGMDYGASFVGTCLAAAFACFLANVALKVCPRPCFLLSRHVPKYFVYITA